MISMFSLVWRRHYSYNSFLFSCSGTENCRANVRLNGRTVDRDGQQYVKFDSLTMKVIVGNARFQLENLFNGDPVLGQLGNQFINENSKLFVDEMIPGFEKNLAKTFLDIVNVVLKDVTFDEMFPDK